MKKYWLKIQFKEFKPQTKIYFDEHNIFIDLKELNNVDFSEIQ